MLVVISLGKIDWALLAADVVTLAESVVPVASDTELELVTFTAT